MAEPLTITVEQPRIRPKGVTAKQWRLAAIYPRAESAYAAMIQAGYAPNTAAKRASNMLDRVGVKRAGEIQAQTQLDSARGLIGLSRRAIAKGAEKLDDLETRDLLAFGLKAAEVGASLGENSEAVGNGDRWRRKARRILRWGYYLGTRATTSSVPPPTE